MSFGLWNPFLASDLFHLSGCRFTRGILRPVNYFIWRRSERIFIVACVEIDERQWIFENEFNREFITAHPKCTRACIRSSVHLTSIKHQQQHCVHTQQSHTYDERWSIFISFCFSVFVMGWCCSQSYIARTICRFAANIFCFLASPKQSTFTVRT